MKKSFNSKGNLIKKKGRFRKGKWHLIQGTIFFRELFYTNRKNPSALWMARQRFGRIKKQDFEHTRVINHAEILRKEES